MNKIEIAKRLRINRTTLDRLIKLNKIECIKNRQCFISSKDFHLFLFNNEEYSYKKLGFGSLRKYVKKLILQ